MVSWKRNLYVLTAAELIAIAGFAVVFPFMPFYIQELGITDPDKVKLWTGLISAAQPVSMAMVAPVWGSLADRYGRKLMVERAMFGGALIFVAMGFARSVEQLVVLRILQGLVTGTVPAATALVASTTPREHAGSSMGTLQTGIFLGASLGPFAGGIIADSLGYRATFWTTSLCLFLAGVAVHALVADHSKSGEGLAGQKDGRLWDGLLTVLRSPLLRSVLIVTFVTRAAVRIVDPMLPLYVQELAADAPRQATITGVIFGAGAFAAAAGAFFLGRASDKIGHRRLLLVCSFGIAGLYIPHALVSNTLQLGILRALVGFLMAGVLASLSALLARRAPEGRQGAVYGINTTIRSAANALGPMMGTNVAILWGLRPIFLLSAGLFALGGTVAMALLPAGLQSKIKRVKSHT